MKTILILGAGFGGLRVAQELEHHVGELDGREIVMVDQCAHHTYTPLLYEVATGYFPSPRATEDQELAAGVQVNYAELQDFMIGKKISFRQGEVTKINTKTHRVGLRDGTEIEYETLVIALGSETDDYGIPGVLEHGMPYKTISDALRLRRKLLEFVSRKKKGQEVQISVVVGGGGATGVELAAELAKFFRHIVSRGDIKAGDVMLTLVEIGPRLLSPCSPTVSDWAYERLSSLGVKALRDTCIKRAHGNKIVLAPRPLREGERVESLLCDFRAERERVIEADVLVWAGGIRASRCLARSGLPTDMKGRVVTEATGRIKGFEHIWAVGDCAAWDLGEHGLPALAQAALREAQLVSRNILHAIHGYRLESLKPRTFPLVLPMGGKYAIFEQGDLRSHGWFPWVIRQAADLRYFFSVTSPLQAVRLYLAGARVYQKND